MHGSAVRYSIYSNSKASFQQRNSIRANASNENKTPTKAEKQHLLNQITEEINKKDFQEKLKKLFTETAITRADLMEYLTNQNSEFEETKFDGDFSLKMILQEILKPKLQILDRHRISSWFSTHTESYKIACSAIQMVLYNCFPKDKEKDEEKQKLSKILGSDSINLSVKDYSDKQDCFTVDHFKRKKNDPSDKNNSQTTSLELQSGGIRNKNYKITVDFHLEKVPEISIELTLVAISEDKKNNPAYIAPYVVKQNKNLKVYAFERINENQYVIHLPLERIILGQGAYKIAYKGHMVTVDEHGMYTNLREIAITKTKRSSNQKNNTHAIVQRCHEVQSATGLIIKGLHLRYPCDKSVLRHSIPRKGFIKEEENTISEYTYQELFEGTLDKYKFTNTRDFLEKLLQITMGLKEATTCKVCVIDIKPDNIFFKTVDGKMQCFLADMDGWMLERSDIQGLDADILNLKAFYMIFRQFLSVKPEQMFEEDYLKIINTFFYDFCEMNFPKYKNLDLAFQKLEELKKIFDTTVSLDVI
jgi:hypothetical protein